jgi:hypothetical protein
VLTAAAVVKRAEESPSFAVTSKVYGASGVLGDISYTQAILAGIDRHKPLVGFAISPTDRVYGWYENQTVSWGNSHDLDATSHGAVAFALPPGKSANDILAMAMSSSGAVYTYYIDGKLSIGTPTDLGATSPAGGPWLTFELPGGVGTSELLGVAIRKADSKAFAWYNDGTYSSGTAFNLRADLPPGAPRPTFSPAATRTIYDLHDADFAADGKLYFHYGQFASTGTASDFDVYQALYSSDLASAPVADDWMTWYGAMQVRHLLTHSAGFWGSGDQSAAAEMFGVDLEDLTYSQVNRYVLATRRLLFAPGATSDYSNHSLGLAGHVLAVHAGMSFETYVRTKILQPLGLTRVVPSGTGNLAYDASPHTKDGNGYLVAGTLTPASNDTGLAAGGYSSTAGDLVRFMLATDKLANHPDFLSAASLTTMETPPFPATVPNRALGWDYSGGKLAKGGDVDDGDAYIAKFPAGYLLDGVNVGGMTIALCANGGTSSSELRQLADEVVKAAAPVAVSSSYDLY